MYLYTPVHTCISAYMYIVNHSSISGRFGDLQRAYQLASDVATSYIQTLSIIEKVLLGVNCRVGSESTN